jgi:bifunctional aspartokinase / homoserine dehydrogenase 1
LHCPEAHAAKVLAKLQQTFKAELDREDIDGILSLSPVSILTVVGAEMCHQVGVAGKVFTAMGEAGVNVMAIAQGSSEVSISMVVNQADTQTATNSLHKLTV